jgi:hypothetical protein
MGKRSKKIRRRKGKRGKRKSSVKKGGLFVDNNQLPLKGKCGGKRKSSSKKKGSNPDKMKDPNLSALCMKCFHSSGKKTKSRVMKLPGRNHTVNSRGRSMIKGACSKCSGKMVVFV